jgi:hypothetical protein
MMQCRRLWIFGHASHTGPVEPVSVQRLNPRSSIIHNIMLAELIRRAQLLWPGVSAGARMVLPVARDEN